MKFAILGSGAVGGYYGAKLARAGHDVTFIARGAHLEAIRARGLEIQSAVLGDFTVRARAEQDTTRVGPVDVVLFAVKAYDNPTALPLLAPMLGRSTTVLTLQNGVDSAGRRWPRRRARRGRSAARPTSRRRSRRRASSCRPAITGGSSSARCSATCRG